jgi:hypothetical protein
MAEGLQSRGIANDVGILNRKYELDNEAVGNN